MTARLLRAVVGTLVFTLTLSRPAEASPTFSTITPVIRASSAVLIDTSDGKVLFEKEADSRRAIASTTKIMTALVVIDKTKPTDVVTASSKAESIGENDPIVTELELTAGEKLTIEQLIYGLLLPSANDAAVALAEHVGGSIDGFAKLMNDKARQLGATNSRFLNPHGLDQPGHVSTARDLAKIARAAMDKPLFRKIVSTRTSELPWPGHPAPRALANRNPLLDSFEGATGIKTGQTLAAGKSLVSSATRDGESRIAVVLASPNPAEDSMNLLNHGFDSYRRYQITKKGQVWGTATYGDGTTVRLIAKKTHSLLLQVGWPSPTEEFQEKTTSVLVLSPEGSQVKVPIEMRCGQDPCPEVRQDYAMANVWAVLRPLARVMAALR